MARINRKNLTENQLAVKNSSLNVCSNHFISGRPSELYETCDSDWAPSISLGYSPHNVNTLVLRDPTEEKEGENFRCINSKLK